MRIAFLHDWLLTWRGGEKCLESLIKHYPKSEVFTIFASKELVDKKLPNIKVYSSFLSRLPWVKKYYRFLLPFYPLAIWQLSRKLNKIHATEKFDVALSISHCAVKNIKMPFDLKHICYCLTPVRYIWDQYDAYFRDCWYEPVVRSVRALFQKWDVSGSSRVTKFIAISDFISSRIKNYYNRESEVIYPPVSIERFLKLDSKGSDYYLMINALVPYKKTQIAVEAFKNLDEKLIIIGDGPEKDRLVKIAPKNVEILGWVDDSQLEDILSKAKALLYLAVEDFGIAPVEAQAAGKPVLCLKEGGCAETAIFTGDFRTGVQISEASPGAVIKAINQFEQFQKKEYFKAENSKSSALRFSEELFVNNFNEVLSKC